MPNCDIQICLATLQGRWSKVVRTARAVEANGLYAISLSDCSVLERDVHLACTACALNTTTTRIVTGVTNPVTRHPSVMASAFLQIEELAPGRVICGIATGDSSTWGIGLKPARVTELREYVVALKSLLRGETAHWRGTEFRGQWSDWEPFDLPVYVACSGPKTIRMAAQVADGVILSVGVAPEDLEWAETQIDAACREIGRDRREVDVWHYSEVTLGESKEAASERSLGLFAHWLTLGGTRGKRIPGKYQQRMLELTAEFKKIDEWCHDQGRVQVQIAKRLRVYDWLMSRSARLWGSPIDVKIRLDELSSLGATNWMLWPDGNELDDAEIATELGRTLELPSELT